MILDESGKISSYKKDIKYVIGNTDYYLQGFLYVEGKVSGEESLTYIEESFRKNGEIPFQDIWGAFSLCIVRDNGEIYFFTCNSNMNAIYLSDKAAGNSFLNLRDWHRENRYELNEDLESMCMYYTLGNIYFGQTFFKEIKVLQPDKYIIWKDGKRSIEDKKTEDIDARPKLKGAKYYFDNLNKAISNCNVAMALTGGYDSRLIFTYLQEDTPMKVYLMSNYNDSPEQRISEKVLHTVGKELEIVEVEKPLLTDDLIREIVKKIDGMTMLNFEGAYHKEVWEQSFKEQGIDLDISGDGGVLHKDWEWLSEFPFYRKKKTNLRKYYKQRVAFLEDAEHIGSRLNDIYRRQESVFLEKLKKYERELNTKSLDMLYYHVNGNRAMYYSSMQKLGVNAYAPLSELEMVRYSYSLPRFKRFFYNYIRELTTQKNREIARIPTGYGTTASSEIKYILRDIVYQGIEYYKKAMRMIGRIFLNKSFYVCDLMRWDFKNDLSQLALSREAIKWAISKNYINEKSEIKKLSYEHLERVLLMYVIIADM